MVGILLEDSKLTTLTPLVDEEGEIDVWGENFNLELNKRGKAVLELYEILKKVL